MRKKCNLAGNIYIFYDYEKDGGQTMNYLEKLQNNLKQSMKNREVEKVRKIIEEIGASSMKDMGNVMGPIMKTLGGKADGKLVQACVKKVLG